MEENTFLFLSSKIHVYDISRTGSIIYSDFDNIEIFEYKCDYCKTVYKNKPVNKFNQECNCYNCGGLIIKNKI